MNTANTNPAAADEAVAPELAGLNLAPRTDGPAAAATLAAGIGIFVLGLLTTLAVISDPLKGFLEDFQGSVGVGSLAGKTILAMVAWLLSWAVLGVAWKERNISLRTVLFVAGVLAVLGVVGTFPPFFEAFE